MNYHTQYKQMSKAENPQWLFSLNHWGFIFMRRGGVKWESLKDSVNMRDLKQDISLPVSKGCLPCVMSVMVMNARIVIVLVKIVPSMILWHIKV